MEDFYTILGVSRSSSDADLKSAYRKKALEWHPDRNKASNAEEMFKKINRAYEVLSDPKKKQLYDQLGHSAYEQHGDRASQGGGQGGPFGGQAGPFTYTYTGNPADFGVDFSDPFDIFNQFFGGGGSPFGGGGRRTRRQVFAMRLSFDEAVKGIEKKTVISGSERTIKIPAGVDNGNRIRFEDFDIQVEVAPHPFFKREDQNLIYEKTITLSQAILGDEIEVPTIDSSIKIRVRPGTQHGSVVRLKDQGIPYPQSHRKGDMYVVYKVHIPEKVSQKGVQLLKELEKELK